MKTTRPLRRTYDVNAVGFTSSVFPEGGWARGTVYRAAMPVMNLPPYWHMYDRTNPATWQPPAWRPF